MTRLLFAIALVVGIGSPGLGTTYHTLSLPELVFWSDIIVVGTATAATDEIRVKVSDTLTGVAGSEVKLLRRRDTVVYPGESRIFFIVCEKDGLALIRSPGYTAKSHTEKVRLLLEMKALPGKYMDDPKVSGSPEYLQMLGLVFMKSDQVGKLTKAKAAAHVGSNLRSHDKEAVLRAVDALEQMGSKDAAMSVAPLLAHAEVGVRISAATFLGWSGDRRGVQPLCDVLDAASENDKLVSAVSHALLELRDSAAVPALRRAIKRGDDGWPCIALGRLGTEKDFELLLNALITRDSGDAAEGLLQLVLRSNKPLTVRNGDLSRKLDWQKWWQENKSEFRVTKTSDERK